MLYADVLSNLFDDLPVRLPAERIDVLISSPGLRVERIVSTGHVTAAGEWLEQDTDEWVVVLRGRARLRIEGEAAPLDLQPGHHVLLRAHVRHRVEWTDDAGPTVWLAVHYRAADRVSGGDLARLLDNTPAPGEESPGTTRPTEGPANSEDKHE